MTDLVDDAEPCRACRGKGYETYPTERGTNITEDCYLCRGTGFKTVRVDRAEREDK